MVHCTKEKLTLPTIWTSVPPTWGCGPWLSVDWCASEWTNLFHLSYLKVPSELSLWVLLHEQCRLPLGNAVAGTDLLTVRMEICAGLELILGLKGCPKRGKVALFHDQGVLHRALHHAPISPIPMCYIGSHLWQPSTVNSPSRGGISRARLWFHTVTCRPLNNKWPVAL